ncbi:MAG: methyltransferase domain-containing protein [Marinovum sp.]|nr:methyltransferase domain-containing protein [Marinovum sp.]
MTQDTPEGVLKPQLWVERTVEETQAVYTEWAKSYEAEVSARGYHTPRRIAEALAAHLPAGDGPILDFGCGTGLSGIALRSAGISALHGTDINAAMVNEARPKGIYETLWVSEPGVLDISHGPYRAIVATGVISLGAAPPETLDILIDALDPGALVALSYNDPTLAHGGFDANLDGHIEANQLELLFREHGPHLDDVNMGSDVIVLKRL